MPGASRPPNVLDPTYSREEILPQDNALAPWREAVQCAVEHAAVNEAVEKYVTGSCCCCESCAGPARFPMGRDAAPLLELISKNARSLELIDEGIHRGRLQLPVPNGRAWLIEEWGPYGVSAGLRTPSRVRRLRIRSSLISGEFGTADRDCRQLLKAAEMLIHSDSIHVTLLIAADYYRSTMAEVANLIGNPSVPASTVEGWVRELSRDPRLTDALIASERAELSYALAELDRLSETSDNEKLLDQLIAEFYPHKPVRPDDDTAEFVPDDRLEKRRQRLLYLFGDHPALYDKRETIDVLISWYRASVAELGARWRPSRQGALDRFARLARWWRRWRDPWPIPVQIGMGYEFIGEDAKSAEMKAMMGFPARSWDVSPARLAKCKALLRKRHNPIGRALAEHLYSPFQMMRECLLRMEASRQATRTVAAIRLFALRFGRRPQKLDELVSSGILDQLPADPFCQKPLRYSPDRAIVWSVGPDGRDDGGQPMNEPFAKRYDLVWNVSSQTPSTTAA